MTADDLLESLRAEKMREIYLRALVNAAIEAGCSRQSLRNFVNDLLECEKERDGVLVDCDGAMVSPVVKSCVESEQRSRTISRASKRMDQRVGSGSTLEASRTERRISAWENYAHAAAKRTANLPTPPAAEPVNVDILGLSPTNINVAAPVPQGATDAESSLAA